MMMKSERIIASLLAGLAIAGCGHVPRQCESTSTPNHHVTNAERVFYVYGEVTKPGIYELTECMTLLRAINAAGGFLDAANPHLVRLLRGGSPSQRYDARAIDQGQSDDVEIQNGDVIAVGRKI